MKNLDKAEEEKNQINILLVGDTNTGKTSFVKRLIFNKYDLTFVASIGVDFELKKIKYKNKIYSIRLFDTAGQERFKSITKSYFRLANAYFIFFDLSNKDSLNHIHNWIDLIKEYSEKSIFIILGNKDDLKKKISDEIINENLERYKDIIFIKISVSKNYNIKEAIERMIDLIEKRGEEEEKTNITLITKSNVKTLKQKQNCC